VDSGVNPLKELKERLQQILALKYKFLILPVCSVAFMAPDSAGKRQLSISFVYSSYHLPMPDPSPSTLTV